MLDGSEMMRRSARKLTAQNEQPAGPTSFAPSCRQRDIYFLGDRPPLRETLELLFASDCERPVELFHFTFAEPSSLCATLPLAHQVQKNFKGYRLAQFLYTPSVEHIDAAYAAGLELIDLPLLATSDRHDADRRGAVLHHARTLFARWMVLVTLHPQSALPSSLTLIDELLEGGILPLLQSPAADAGPSQEWLTLYQFLVQRWQLHKINLRPIAPLLAEPPRKGVNSLLERASEAGQRAAADLRRLLRVRGAEQSFDSAGL
jgi:hypothetical protein